MAVGNSHMYGLTLKTSWDGTDYILDFANDTIKAALYTNSLTPDPDVDTVYNTTNEHAATGNYTQGGIALTTKTLTLSPTGTLKFDADDLIWTPTFTLSGVRATKIYDDTTASKKLLCLISLGADYAVTSGIFTIQFATTGFATIDYTP